MKMKKRNEKTLTKEKGSSRHINFFFKSFPFAIQQAISYIKKFRINLRRDVKIEHGQSDKIPITKNIFV